MTTLEDLWPGVEQAPPDKPGPLLVAADWFDENDKPELAYALTWCAGHGKRPLVRTDVAKWRFRWVRRQESYKYGTISGAALRRLDYAVVPYFLFAAHREDFWKADFSTALWAYEWLGTALRCLRNVVEVPTIIRPPAPQIIASGPAPLELVTCGVCGIVRGAGVIACPFCRRPLAG